MKLDNSSYNKIKLLHNLSGIIWFIEKHAILDAEQAGDRECLEILNSIKNNAEKHVEKLQRAMCMISQ